MVAAKSAPFPYFHSDKRVQALHEMTGNRMGHNRKALDDSDILEPHRTKDRTAQVG